MKKLLYLLLVVFSLSFLIGCEPQEDDKTTGGDVLTEEQQLVVDAANQVLQSEEFAGWVKQYSEFTGENGRMPEITEVLYYENPMMDIEGYLVKLMADVGYFWDEAGECGSVEENVRLFISSETANYYDHITLHANDGITLSEEPTEEEAATYLLWVYGNMQDVPTAGSFFYAEENVTVLSGEELALMNQNLSLTDLGVVFDESSSTDVSAEEPGENNGEAGIFPLDVNTWASFTDNQKNLYYAAGEIEEEITGVFEYLGNMIMADGSRQIADLLFIEAPEAEDGVYILDIATGEVYDHINQKKVAEEFETMENCIHTLANCYEHYAAGEPFMWMDSEIILPMSEEEIQSVLSLVG